MKIQPFHSSPEGVLEAMEKLERSKRLRRIFWSSFTIALSIGVLYLFLRYVV